MLPSDVDTFEDDERFIRYSEFIDKLKDRCARRQVTLVDDYGALHGISHLRLREQLERASHVLVPLCEFTCTELVNKFFELRFRPASVTHAMFRAQTIVKILMIFYNFFRQNQEDAFPDEVFCFSKVLLSASELAQWNQHV